MTGGTRPRITVSPLSNVGHLQQLFAGFEALDDAGALKLAYRFDARPRFGLAAAGVLDPSAFLLVAEIADGPTLCFDTHDSATVSRQLYDVCDVYLKRSYAAAEHGGYARMLPLGPNFEIERGERSRFALFRALWLPQERSRTRVIARALRLPGNRVVTEQSLGMTPRAAAEPRVLFVTRAWDPGETRTPDPQKTRERLAISTMRAECVRRLRAAFGDRFVGGLYRDAFAAEHFADAMVPESMSTDRAAHLARLPGFDICVSSAGLHRSTGWKFTEYLAAGRAIVAEHMAFGAPGGLADGVHYLGFADADACVAAATALADDRDCRQRMMAAAQAYYREWVSPAAMVRHALTSATKAGAPRR